MIINSLQVWYVGATDITITSGSDIDWVAICFRWLGSMAVVQLPGKNVENLLIMQIKLTVGFQTDSETLGSGV